VTGLQNDYAIQTINLFKAFQTKQKLTKNIFNSSSRTSKIVIDNLNLQINKGELFGLLGPNGAGKTTLVKMLCTLLPPDSGTAKINGYDVIKQPMQVKQSLGTLFSVGERGFFWRLNGYRNLEFYAAIFNVPRNIRKERISEILKLVGLQDNADESYQKYSGGMKRKLALARALLANPPVLLLDEPTVGLDVISSRSLRDFVKNTLSKQGTTILYTTHYIEEAAQICNKIGIMSSGRLIACDTPDKIRNLIKKGEIINITIENMTEQQLVELKNRNFIVNLTENNNTEDLLPKQKSLSIELENIDDLPAVFDFLFERKIKLLNFQRKEPTLEDAFIELTRSKTK
jgi:ABC-2 type transport system ATP-binding protein